MQNSEESALDTALIIRRRTELGLSQRAVAREMGMTSAAMSVIESGRSHSELTLRNAGRLAAALAIPLRALVRAEDHESEASEETRDDVVVETVIAKANQAIPTQELAAILGWDIRRVSSAVAALGRRLAGTGVVLHRASSGYLLRPRGDLLDESQIKELERLRLRTRQVRQPGMRLLHEVATRGIPREWEHKAGNAARVNLRMLVNAYLIDELPNGFAPAADLNRSLKLGQEKGG
jgi:transcriptional regulator with XRE-family HTH domain